MKTKAHWDRTLRTGCQRRFHDLLAIFPFRHRVELVAIIHPNALTLVTDLIEPLEVIHARESRVPLATGEIAYEVATASGTKAMEQRLARLKFQLAALA